MINFPFNWQDYDILSICGHFSLELPLKMTALYLQYHYKDPKDFIVSGIRTTQHQRIL